jgi:hypothetical protein
MAASLEAAVSFLLDALLLDDFMVFFVDLFILIAGSRQLGRKDSEHRPCREAG